MSYSAVWRWHFYAGLFCLPFVTWLAITGSIYLWKPQIEAMIDRPFAHVATGPDRASVAAQAAAATAAVSGSTLRRYQLPDDPEAAGQVIVGRGGIETRVYVHPQTLGILKVVNEEDRFMRIVFRLHGELMMGERGSWLVELAACWAIVMILTGLFLWWPRGQAGPAGVLWPRLRGSMLWRDAHAVTGFWVSLLALFLLFTGLPWASAWGDYLKAVRAATGASVARQDWANHHADHSMVMHAPRDYRAIDLVSAAAAQQRLAPPVLIVPPEHGRQWTVRSDAANRPLRSTLTIDGSTGAVLAREAFAERHWIDRVVGYGVAAHEGQLFGLANQMLGLATAAGLVLLTTSGAVMWWRRRPSGTLGAPMVTGSLRLGWLLAVILALLGALLPIMGLSLLVVLALEALVLRRIPRLRVWLGLRPPRLVAG